MSEQAPTQDEINRVVAHLVRQECAASNHAPTHRIATLADPIGTYRCECGTVAWVRA